MCLFRCGLWLFLQYVPVLLIPPCSDLSLLARSLGKTSTTEQYPQFLIWIRGNMRVPKAKPQAGFYWLRSCAKPALSAAGLSYCPSEPCHRFSEVAARDPLKLLPDSSEGRCTGKVSSRHWSWLCVCFCVLHGTQGLGQATQMKHLSEMKDGSVLNSSVHFRIFAHFNQLNTT